MSDINTGRMGTPLGDALRELAALRAENGDLRGLLAETVPDPEYRRMQDIEIERLREERKQHKQIATDLGSKNNRLREALTEAREDVAHWGGYASDYFKEKHDLAGDLARIDAALAKEAGG
jgi:hypothetical protein